MIPRLSVILPTHSPHPGRLQRTLAALQAQTLPLEDWELLVVDNASSPPLTAANYGTDWPALGRIVVEPSLGLTAARRRGFAEARGEIFVLVDDDNVLSPDYLANVEHLFAEHPQLGVMGGRSVPEFETEPPAWVRVFDGLLACRDLGDQPLIAADHHDPRTDRRDYPNCAPIGAGMALLRKAVMPWVESSAHNALSDRRGTELSSGGDNDIVLSVLKAGWQVGYFPGLSLTHLIPASRTQPGYLARLNRGIAKSWVQVLEKHHANPWPPIPRWTVPLRQLKAWFTCRAWSGPVARIRWAGACGHFAGRGLLYRT